MSYIDACIERSKECGMIDGPEQTVPSESTGSVPMSELTKLLDVWEYRIGETNLRTDYDRGMEKGFQICADGLRRKIEQNDKESLRGSQKGSNEE